MAHQTIDIIPGTSFAIVHDIDEPKTIHFKLHNHDDIYEIVFVQTGDCEFYVEGNSYRLKAHDICCTRPFELHQMTFLSDQTYDRIVLYLKSEFFLENNCTEFLVLFQNRQLGTGNVVDGEENPAAADCIRRLYGYYEEQEYSVMNHVIIELLYLLNRSQSADKFYTHNERIRNIIMYINRHLTEPITLDALAQRFFIDKHYLCKVFKKCTGHTISQYVNYKRILLVQEMRRSGQSLLKASMNAGFNSYAHFYKMYVKQMGHSPKDMN